MLEAYESQKSSNQKQQSSNNSLTMLNTHLSVGQLRRQVSQLIYGQIHIDKPQWSMLLDRIKGVQIWRDNKQMVKSQIRLLKGVQFQQLKQPNNSKLSEFKPKQIHFILHLLKTTTLTHPTHKQQLWRCRQMYLEGEHLLQLINSIQFQDQSVNKPRITEVLLINRLHYCMKFDMLQKALQTVDRLILHKDKFNTDLHQLLSTKNIILMKMGCKTINHPQHTFSSIDCDGRSNDKKLCIQIIMLNKQTLPTFISTMRNQSISISAYNLYNLALVCHKHGYINESIQILAQLTTKPNQEQNRFRSKCLALLAQLYEQRGQLQQALATLNQIQLKQHRDIMSCEYRKLILMRKIKIEKTASTCPLYNPVSTKKLHLLTGLQNQLNLLVNDTPKTSKIAKRQVTKLYEITNRVRGMKKVLTRQKLKTLKSIDLRKTQCEKKSTSNKFKYKSSLSTNSEQFIASDINLHHKKLKQPPVLQTKLQNCPSNQNIKTKQVQLDSFKKTNQKTKTDTTCNKSKLESKMIEVKQQPKIMIQTQEQPQTVGCVTTKLVQDQVVQGQSAQKVDKSKQKKVVKFIAQQNENINDIIYRGEQKITSLFLSQAYSQIQSQIRSSLLELKQQKSCPQIHKFIIKCSKWYRQLGNDNESISLLKSTIAAINVEQEGVEFKKQCLKLLGQIYQDQKDSKSAINIYLQLGSLGLIQYYDKLGQLEMMKQHYHESIKYYEMYNEYKNTIYSRSKLAHAYSKMPIYKKKSVDLLNQILFQNKNCIIFRQFDVQKMEDVQKAVLLLVSIYMSYQSGIEKAKIICQKFLEINFSAQPIYYMLGVMYEDEGNKQEAFNAFLTALKLKPNHIPSLIRIVNDIGIQSGNNYQIINILRKAYVQDSRNWQLLQLLIQSITLAKQEEKRPSVQQLVRYAKILKKAEVSNGDMDLQIQMVWTWAFQVMQFRRRKEQVVEDDNQNQINMRLGEINMIKGNFRVSEFYLKKVLAKLQLRRKRTGRRRDGKMKLQIEALQRLSYIKSRQNQNAEIKLIIDNNLTIPKDEIEQRQAILKTLIHTRRF